MINIIYICVNPGNAAKLVPAHIHCHVRGPGTTADHFALRRMPMNSREIVIATLDFSCPPRVARSFEFDGRPSDFLWADQTATTHATEWRQAGGQRWERTDEWGNLWARVDASSKGEVVKGVLDTLDSLDTLRLPDFSHASDYESVRKARAANPDKYLIGGIPGFTFNIARKLRRLDNYLIDLLMEPERMRVLHDCIDRALVDMIVNYAGAGVDAVMFPEDWGTQSQVFIDPGLWHEEFHPRFKRLCACAHDRGIKVFMHSCGMIEAIVPSLIRAGIDVLQFDQPDLHGIDILASYQEDARITFWCPVDIQRVLPAGREQAIRAKAREMLDKLWRVRGGFIAGFYPGMSSIGVEPGWQAWACEEFDSAGKREAVSPAA
ncbi:MAG: hypothetical protein GF418_07855 [Chitinivibrionales bacterium]|nr:hypothetical protein [Chitinivibrionales bacterium]MBD3395526.1 hypothetical protein [Chitinivibrionales bacterium]